MAIFESGFQDAVNSATDGFLNLLLRAVSVVIIAAALFGYYFYSQFRGLKTAESMEYAQLARNISEGRYFTTSCVRPSDMWFLAKRYGNEPIVSKCPDIRHPPLYPAVVSLGLRIVKPSFDFKQGSLAFAPEVQVIVPLCILFAIATGLLVYLIGAKLFDKRVGFVSMIAFFLSKTVLDAGISGLPDSMVMFLVSAACYAAVCFWQAKAEDKSLGWLTFLFLLAAFFSGAAVLTSYQMVILAPVLGFFMISGFLRRGWLVVMAFLLVVALMVSPWLLRNLKVSGGLFGMAPYSALHDTTLGKGGSFDSQFKPVVDSSKVIKAVKRKIMTRFAEVWENDLRTVGNGIMICFFLVSMFYKYEREDVNLFKWFIAAAMLLAVFSAVIFSPGSSGVFASFLPVIIIYGTAMFFAVIASHEFADAAVRGVMITVLVLLSALSALFVVCGPSAHVPYPPYYPPFVSYVSSLLGDGEIMCSDIPWATAWYGRRTSLLIPESPEEFMRISGLEDRIKGLYLATLTAGISRNDVQSGQVAKLWMPVLGGMVPPEFPLKHGITLPEGGKDQLFLADRIRWKPDIRK